MLENSYSHIFYRALLPLGIAWLLTLLSFLIPVSSATSPPPFDLSQAGMDLVYWISESAKYGAPLVVLLAVVVIVSRYEIDPARRRIEFIVIALTASVLAVGGAIANEQLVKTGFQVPRPNIQWLAGENGEGPLGMTVDAFYAVDNDEIRQASVAGALAQETASIDLTTLIRAHWIRETGFSFPSGHSFSAMFIASFMLMLAAGYPVCRRYWLIYLLLPWALAVCFSRPVLGVHSAADVTIGGLLGILTGLLAWAISIKLVHRYSR